MFKKMFLFRGMFLIAGAAVVVTPVPGQAQRYLGTGQAGPAGPAGYPSAHYGGSGYGGNYYGSPHTYMPPRYQYFYSSPLHGYSGYSPYYGYPPNYYPSGGYAGSGSGYNPAEGYPSGGSKPDPYPYNNPALQPDLRDTGSYGAGAPYYPYAGFAPENLVARPDTTAHITVTVPQDAEVWFEGSPTSATGTVREYQSPPLAPGNRYAYEVRARWNKNGREVTQTQRVEATAGSRVGVNFPAPAKGMGQ
jgi:uncharacterized protein (TIGR03000 family)